MDYMFAMESYLIMKVQEEVETFVTRKITRGLTEFDMGLEKCLYVGNLDEERLGHAKDYVEMQMADATAKPDPDDYVIATGRMESVRKFIELTASKLGWGLEK